MCPDPKPNPKAMLYFPSFVIVGTFVMVNLFIGVIGTSMDTATTNMRESQVWRSRWRAARETLEGRWRAVREQLESRLEVPARASPRTPTRGCRS